MLVIVLEKKTDKKESEIVWHHVISVDGPKEGVLWGLGEKEADCQTDFTIIFFFYHVYHKRFKIAVTLCKLLLLFQQKPSKLKPVFSIYFWTSG